MQLTSSFLSFQLMKCSYIFQSAHTTTICTKNRTKWSYIDEVMVPQGLKFQEIDQKTRILFKNNHHNHKIKLLMIYQRSNKVK